MKRYFHLSKVDLGEQVVLEPKVPESAVTPECVSTPRVCFAPTLFQCLISISGSSNTASAMTEFLYSHKTQFNNPTVYSTTSRKLILPKYPKCSDYQSTGEHWSLRPIKVRRLGYLDMTQLLLYQRMVVGQRPGHDLSQREMQLLRTITNLSDSKVILSRPAHFESLMKHTVVKN